MITYYLQIKQLHILSVLLSGGIFTVRGLLMLARQPAARHLVLRIAAMSVDTILLTTALILIGIIHQYPFVHSWLTVKVVLLVVYIVLGTLALKRGRTRRVQVTCFFAALLVYLYILAVGFKHHPLGIFA